MIRTISPVDGSVYVERELATEEEIEEALGAAADAFAKWRLLPLERRRDLVGRMVDAFTAQKQAIAEELTWQMGRPIAHAPFEVDRFEERARAMMRLAPGALADIVPDEREGFRRFIRREPLGVVLVMAPWNYPYLTAVNAVVPALLAGNTVVLKHSAQTPLCAERMVCAGEEAGLPEGVFRFLHLSHRQVAAAIADHRVSHVAFTGSVEGGRQVQGAMMNRFITMGLELGGKDPAYVRHDADLAFTVENVVDGAFFNAGQSCCGIERIYVHRSVYREFVRGAVEAVSRYRLGNPFDPATTLGPVVSADGAAAISAQVEDALARGARSLVDPGLFPAATPGTAYLAPQVLVDVTHDMALMREETFGPAVGIMEIPGDDEAVALMNDSPYGLTASIWTRDEKAALEIGSRIETGTVYLNRCDYLDPELAWTGVKDSGRGCTLSRLGYEHLTRPKSFHFRLT